MAISKAKKKKRRLMMRRKRTLDPSIVIDYKKPDTLKRFITDRGKIIPRRISGATAAQQRQITRSVKRARFLALIPYCVSHRSEKGFAGDMAAAATGTGFERRGGRGDFRGERRGERDRDHRGGDREHRGGGDRERSGERRPAARPAATGSDAAPAASSQGGE